MSPLTGGGVLTRGRAYSALIDMPKLANYFKRILLETLYVLEDMLNEEEFAKIENSPRNSIRIRRCAKRGRIR